MYCSQKLGEDFAKFCGLLRIYELYHAIVRPTKNMNNANKNWAYFLD